MKNVCFFVLSVSFVVSTLSAFPETKVHSVYYNPLTLNGKTLLPEQFTLASKGSLSLVTGPPESADAVKIPFVLRLKRDGVRVSSFPSLLPVTEIDISRMLAYARIGDELIIESTDDAVKIVRVLKVTPYLPVPYFHWFGLPEIKKDNC